MAVGVILPRMELGSAAVPQLGSDMLMAACHSASPLCRAHALPSARALQAASTPPSAGWKPQGCGHSPLTHVTVPRDATLK